MRVRPEDCETPSMNLYRMLPAVNDVLLMERVEALLRSNPRKAALASVQAVLEALRKEIGQGLHSEDTLTASVHQIPEAVAVLLKKRMKYSLRNVINATGVILHTNLGRAPLSRAALDHMVEAAQGYSNLEFDLDTGERGARDVHVEALLIEVVSQAAGVSNLTDTHRAIVVNNCAAATFLALHALAKGTEVLVSRGSWLRSVADFAFRRFSKSQAQFSKKWGQPTGRELPTMSAPFRTMLD